jgi:zinc transport system substrate-binding protein
MRSILRRSFLLILIPLFLSGCGGGGEDAQEDLRPVVVASIFPLGDLVKRMAGDAVRIEVVLPPGASPATFDVTPRQLRDMEEAALFLMIGGGLDEWISDLPSASEGSVPVVRLSDGIPLLAGEEPEEDEEAGHDPAHDHGAGNPHIWLDPILVRDQVLPKLEEALVSALPEHAAAIVEGATLLGDSLTALNEEIREMLAPLETRAFIATHSAWTYFAARYGLEEAGVIHAHPGEEPSSRELAGLLEVAQNRGITCLFAEPQLGEVAIRALASELSLPTCMLDPLGGPEMEDREGYFQLLRFNARQLVEGLGGPDR